MQSRAKRTGCSESGESLRSLCRPFGGIAASILSGSGMPELDTRFLWLLRPALALAAGAALDGESLAGIDRNAVVEALDDGSLAEWQDRAVAAALCGRLEMTPEERERATAALASVILHVRERRLRFAVRRWSVTAWLTFLCIGSVGMLWSASRDIILVQGEVPGWLGVIRIALSAFVLIVSLWLITLPPRSYRSSLDRDALVRAAAAVALGRLDAPEHAGALASAAQDSKEVVREAALVGLLKTLPLLEPRHCGTLSANAVPDLCRLLYPLKLWLPEDSEAPVGVGVGRRIGILKALRHVGDGRAVTDVRELADRALSSEVRKAALDLLPILEERRERERGSDRLLRPAQQSEQAALLLVPASLPDGVPAGELLRPINLDESRRAA